MPRLNNFVDDFQNEHVRLTKLIASFRAAIESSDSKEAKEILSEIDAITDGHFDFEEVYLYPRLRRLVFEITESLRNEQRLMKDFISETKDTLGKSGLNKEKSNSILSMLPRLSKLFADCDYLVFLVKKFGKKDEDLEKRFKEFSKRKSFTYCLVPRQINF